MTVKEKLHEKNLIESAELQKLSDIVSKNKRTSHWAGFIGLFAGILGFTVTIYDLYKVNNEKDKIINENQIKEIKIDSLTAYKDTLDSQMSRKDSINQLINLFLTEKKNDKRLTYFYADTVKTYYLKRNVSLQDIKSERKLYNQLNPKSKVVFDEKDISINLKHDNTATVYVNVLYFPDSLLKPKEIIYQIKLNKDKKVYYVRNWEPNPKVIN